MGERLIQEAVQHFRAARVPEYRFPERAASALAVLAQRAEYLTRAAEIPITRDDVDTEQARELLENAPQDEAGFLAQATVNRLIAAYGIPPLLMELARSKEQAAWLARRVGFPVALKVASLDIPHKSDVGGVMLSLRDERAVMEGFEAILQKARAARPEANIRGVHVQRMVLRGQEVIVGAVQDPQFGPLVMFGSGGVEVEGLRDVAFALAPVTREEAEHMLQSTWAGRRLDGYRHILPGDRAAVVETIVRLAQLAADFPQLAEIEINPLHVRPAGQGVFAVDVRARLAG
jgi:acetyltransferase